MEKKAAVIDRIEEGIATIIPDDGSEIFTLTVTEEFSEGQTVIIEENGIKIAVDVKGGQKTGYFLDQKENRLAARKYCKDKTVLDCFSNTGGFSLNTATVAKEVTAVDISPTAIASVNENKELNGFNQI